ncbi:MAG TPA: ATP-binding protein, partial [Thermomicrobiales bacterium]|nr:ATP-binding protein [Thermomicrobiales bacterium]
MATRRRDLFARIRWRLVGWNVLVVALILALVGGAAYAAAAQRLLAGVDLDLAQRAAALPGPPRGGDGMALGEDQLGDRGGFFFLLVDGGGQVLDNPQQVALPTSLTLPAAGDRALYETVTVNGQATRLYIHQMPPSPDHRSSLAAYAVVGQSLAPTQAALRRLLLGLVAAGLVGLLLAVAGAWFLAGRALVPIAAAFRRQQEFVADASHELRTPLTALRAAADLLSQHRDEPLAANADLLDDLRAELARLERLAGDLLTLARADLETLDLAVAPVDLAGLAAEVARRATPLARERGVSLTAAEGEGEVVAEVDPDRLQQALLILLDNALKHTPTGGKVTVAARREGGEAVLAVRDTGAGIAVEHLPRLFERFYRADRARAGAGAGLGLAIAKAIADAHGGRLTLASTVGQGTTATLRLP